MKARGENYSKVKIKGVDNKDGLPEKELINGEELILLEKDFSLNNGKAESGIGKVTTLRDAVENVHSAFLYDKELYCELSSSISCSDFIVELEQKDFYCELTDKDNSNTCLVNWNSDFYTIQDIYNLQQKPYIPDGGELVLLGGIDPNYENGSHTGATTLNELVENLNIDGQSDFDINENLLSLVKNNRNIDLTIIDRIGRDSWIVTANVESLTDIERFDKEFLEYTKVPSDNFIHFYFNDKLEEGNSSGEKYSDHFFDGSNIFKIKGIKSSAQVYLWGVTKSGLNIPILTFKLSDFFTGDEPSSFNDLEEKQFFVLYADNNDLSIKIEGNMKWLDRDFRVEYTEATTPESGYFRVEDPENSFNPANFYPEYIILYNPEIHQLSDVNNNGSVEDIYGTWVSWDSWISLLKSGKNISNLKNLPMYSNSVYVVLKGYTDNTKGGFLVYPLKRNNKNDESDTSDSEVVSFTKNNTVQIINNLS